MAGLFKGPQPLAARALLCGVAIVFAGLCGGVQAAPGRLGGSASSEKSTRIVGGEPTGAALPWMVSLQRYGQHFCGGSLIHPEWILTAAHCAKYLEAPHEVVLGAYNSSDPRAGQRRANDPRRGHSIEVIHHPQYTHNADYDMALLKVSPPFRIEDADLMRIADREALGMPDGVNNVWVVGWGLEKWGPGKTMDELRKVKVPLVGKRECEAAYPGRIQNHQICAGARNKDSCSGDSGGPLYRQSASGTVTQIGVVSWGRGCGWAGFYGVYSSVWALRDFVYAHVPGLAATPDGTGDTDGNSSIDEPQTAPAWKAEYEALNARCGELSRGACRSRLNTESCVFAQRRCQAQPVKSMPREEFCKVMATRPWCSPRFHAGACVWSDSKCSAVPTSAPTLAPTLAPTVRNCRRYRRMQGKCEEDWSCEWNGSAPLRRRCTRRSGL